MEMDRNQFFFKFPMCILEKSLTSDCGLFFLGEITSYFPPGAQRVIAFQRRGSLTNIWAVFASK